MIYRAFHKTVYRYSEPVSMCHNHVYLTPPSDSRQNLLRTRLDIDPEPEQTTPGRDYFGNHVVFFTVQEQHTSLTIAATSVVDVKPMDVPPEGPTPAWEEVRDHVASYPDDEALDAFQYCFDSPFVRTGVQFASYALPSFPVGRGLVEAVADLNRRIHEEFRYEPMATTIATPVVQVLRERHGVCQDFANVMIGCLRSLRLPARYVSGYLRSGPRMVGAEASHAWVQVWCPGAGWIDFDPTNNVMPSGAHLTVARGRDYGDVTPVKGVAFGGGAHTVEVSVVVTPEFAEPDNE